MESQQPLLSQSVEPLRETTPLLVKEKPDELKSNAPSWYDVFVCSLAYTVATLFVLSPLRVILGSSGSKHTAATTAVWFHPARTLGNLIEVLFYTIRLLFLTFTVCLCEMTSVRLLHLLNFPQWVTTIMLICWFSGTLGAIGIMKVRESNQSFNTASSAAIIFLISALLREDDAQKGALPLSRLLNYLEMVAIGAGVSTVTSIIFYRKTSLAFLTKNNHDLSRTYGAMLELLVASFGSEIDSNFAKTNAKANTMLTQLSQHKMYAGYEIMVKSRLPWARHTNIKEQRAFNRIACDHLASLKRQSMHLGGMLHCASVVNSLAAENDEFICRLRKPMLQFARKVALYTRDPHKSSNSTADIKNQLIRYTHLRDDVLRNYSAEHLDNNFEAACILFTHLLQNVAEEMTIGKYKRACSLTARTDAIVPPKSVSAQNEQAIMHFSQLTEALAPTRKATTSGFGPKLWKLLRMFRNLDVRHGIRVCLGATILCIPAFIPEYRSLFQKWHGEWALITFMIILARNLGAMTHNIPLRLIGTSIGAIIGILANELFDTKPLPLFVTGFFVSLGCYRRILSKVNPVFGRFILLSYNLVCLCNFSMAVDLPDDTYNDGADSIYDIAFHRVVSVIVGILWAVFVTVTIWPHSARQALRADLCIQWMRIGMVWKSDPLGLVPTKLTCSSNTPVLRFRGIPPEHELQAMMLELDVHLANSPNEFRLRGKFDAKPYKRLLESTQVILDAFHSISVMIDEEPLVTPREQDFVNLTSTERRELCHLLFLQFYTASASVRLGFPVPEYLPGPDHPLSRLADKIGTRRLEMGASKHSRPLSEENYDFVLLYSYITVVMTVSAELKRIHQSLREIFGSLDDEILFAYV